jgi:hypothetical protein
VTADEYLRRVWFAFYDLPWRTKRELVDEIRGHLDELPADTDLRERLGTPEDYAAELRSAAGLYKRRGVLAFLRARRPRNVVLAAIFVTVIGLAIGAVVWVQGYQPIAFAGASYLPAHTRGSIGLNGSIVTWRKGKPFRYGISIVNNGPFAVRVLGMPYNASLPFSARLLMSTPGPPSEVHVFPGPLQPFHQFDLQPGDISSLILKGVYACHSGTGPGPSLSIDQLPVRISFLWRHKTVWIPLDGELVFDFPHGCTYQKP